MKARIPGGSSSGGMMKKIQEMQENMTRIQQEVEATEFSSSVGGGAVEVAVNGAHQVTAVKLKPEIVDPEDIEMLEDLIMNGASRVKYGLSKFLGLGVAHVENMECKPLSALPADGWELCKLLYQLLKRRSKAAH